MSTYEKTPAMQSIAGVFFEILTVEIYLKIRADAAKLLEKYILVYEYLCSEGLERVEQKRKNGFKRAWHSICSS